MRFPHRSQAILKHVNMNIVSLVPSQTELLHYLLPSEKIVGVTRFCIHPNKHFKTTQKIGGTKDFDFDKIDALKPDLIIGNKEENYKDGIEQLQKKYTVWISEIYTVENALKMIDSVGKLVDEPEKSNSLIAQINNKFETLNNLNLANRNLKVAYFIWKKPYMVAAGNNYINDILNKIGLQNIFSNEIENRYPEIDIAYLKEQNPDYIFLSSEPYPFKERHIAEFKILCPNASVKIVDGEMFSWYGSRMLKAGDYLLNFQKKLIGHSV